MFQITKLTVENQTFISSLQTSGKSRSLEASIALGRLLSNDCIMPSAPVDNIVAFFKLQNSIDLNKVISEINELVLLDTRLVEDLTLKFFQLRYQNLFPAKHVIAINPTTAIEDFFGISKFFDKATLDVIKDNAASITRLVNNFRKLIEEIKG